MSIKVYSNNKETASVNMIDAAIRYARAGFAVFPCEPDGKAPNCSHGFKDATTDENRIRQLVRGADNIGIACGQASGGLVVVDCDVHGADGVSAFDAVVSEYGGDDIELLTARTPSGGKHVYFRTALSPLFKSVARRIGIDGCDLRSDGGYVIAPPSTIAGASYEFDDFDPGEFSVDEVPELPRWLACIILSAQYGNDKAQAAMQAIELGKSVDTVAAMLKQGTSSAGMTVLVDGKPTNPATTSSSRT